MRRCYLSVFFALCYSVSSAVAQEAPVVLKNLESVVQAELAKKSPNPAGSMEPMAYSRGASVPSVLLQLRTAVRSGGARDLIQIQSLLDQLTIALPTEPVKDAAVKVAGDLQKERDQKEKEQAAELDAACKQASEALHKATKPEDLDEVMARLSHLRADRAGKSGSELAGLGRIEAAVRFLREWQTVLVAEKDGASERVRNILDRLTNEPSSPDLMPRSELLALMQKYPNAQEQKAEAPKPEEIDKLVAQAKTLDGVDDVIQQLRKIQSKPRPMSYAGSIGDPVNATLNTLVSISRTYHEFQAGLPTKFEITTPQPGDATSPSVTPLKAQLLMLVLPRYLNLPGDLSIKSGETVNDFLQRMMDEGRRRGDPTLFSRAKDVQRSLLTGNYNFESPTGTNGFIGGENQEKAGQYMLAVVSYQNALRSGGEAMPVKVIGERLAALKEAHPQEYQEGMRQFLNPPPQPRWDESVLRPGALGAPPVISMPIPGKPAPPPVAKDAAATVAKPSASP